MIDAVNFVLPTADAAGPLLAGLTLPLAQLFLTPWLAWAAIGAASIPIIIHILNRRRFRRVVWAAMEWLLAANRKNAKRVRFEQWLLLAIRTLAILLAVLALAQPLLRESTLAGVVGQQVGVHAIVIDRSHSMQQPGEGDGTAFDAAIAEARRLVEEIQPSDRLTLVVAGSPSRAIISEPTADREAVLQAINDIQPGFGSADFASAIAQVAAIFDGLDNNAGSRIVHVLTDASGPAFAGEDARTQPLAEGLRSLAETARIDIVNTRGNASENVAIVDVAIRTALVATDRPTPVRVTVANLSDVQQSDLEVPLSVGGVEKARLALGTLAAGEVKQFDTTVTFDEAGPTALQASLLRDRGDALTADDERFITVTVRQRVPVLLIDGSPGATRLEGATGLIDAALAPRLREDAGTLVETRTITDVELASEPLGAYEAIFLANVRMLSPTQWQRLADFARAGGAVVTFVGEQTNIDQYNEYGFADGAGVLPAELGRSRTATPSNTPENAGFWRFELANRTNPIVATFADFTEGGLYTSTIDRYIELDLPQPGEPGSSPPPTPLLGINNGDAAMVLRPVGEGVSVMFAFPVISGSAGVRWTDLGAKPDWVSLMQFLIEHIVPREGQERTLLVGEPMTTPLLAEQAARAPQVETPDGETQPLTEEADEDGLSAVLAETDRPGVYRFLLGTEVIPFAANVDTAESNLRTPTNAVPDALGVDASTREAGSRIEAALLGESPSSDIAFELLLIALGLFLLETLLAQRFGHHTTGASSPVVPVPPSLRTAA